MSENAKENGDAAGTGGDFLLPLEYPVLYDTPKSYKPPSELANDCLYPNLNFDDYKSRPINRVLKIHKMWETVTINEHGHIAIGTNKCSGREWNGSFWGFENMENMSEEHAKYKLQCDAQITKLRFVKENMLLVTLINGFCQLWSTFSEVRNLEQPYTLFKVGSKCEHEAAILGLDAPYNKNVAATGGEDYKLKIWNIGAADLEASHTYRFAHLDCITDVAFSNDNNEVLATCSYDKSVMLWDLRKTLPASAVLEHHSARIKSVAWSKVASEDNIIYAGDEVGDIYTLDIRVRKKPLKKINAFDYAIRKIFPHSNGLLGLIADTNTVKVLRPQEDKFMYTNADALNYVRDGVWYDEQKLITVGFDGKLLVHELKGL